MGTARPVTALLFGQTVNKKESSCRFNGTIFPEKHGERPTILDKAQKLANGA